MIGQNGGGLTWSLPDNCDQIKSLEQFSNAPLFELVRPCANDFTAAEVIEVNRLYVSLYALIVQAMAGTEAERCLFPDQTPMQAASDVRQAAAHAKLIASDLKAAMTLLDHARIDAARILIANKYRIEAVAAALIEHKTLDAAQIEAVLAGRPLRRKQWNAKGAELFLTMTGGGLKPLAI